MKAKEKNSKTKKTVKSKKNVKKLGMGLSSLLSKDAELSSVIKAKITEKADERFNVKRLSLGVKPNVDKVNVGVQTLAIYKDTAHQNLVSGKFQPRKNF